MSEKDLWKKMPPEQLVKLFIQRPVSPALSRYVEQERPDVLAVYETLRKIAGWA